MLLRLSFDWRSLSSLSRQESKLRNISHLFISVLGKFVFFSYAFLQTPYLRPRKIAAMPPPHLYRHHDEDDVHHHHHRNSPPPPKPNPQILSILLKAIIMTLITSLFFLLLGLAALILLPVLFTSLHRHHNGHRRADHSDGLSPKELKGVPQFKLLKRVKSQLGSESETECVVCLEGFKQGQWCRVLVGCGHVFHRKCVDTWLVKVAACPTCRTTVC